MKFRGKKILFPLVAVILGIVASIFLLEATGRIFFRNRVILGLPLKDLLRDIKDVDHRLPPNSAPDINSDGIRSRHESDYFREEDFSIVFLGDSFTYGLFLPYDQTIPFVFEAALRTLNLQREAKVANFGWTSSSPLLSFRLLKDIGSRYHPDVVLLLVDMTDFYDDILYSNMLDRKGIYRLLRVAPFTCVLLKIGTGNVPALEGFHVWLFRTPARRYFISAKPLEETLPWISNLQRNIDDIDRYCTQILGARFALVILPRAYQYNALESPHNLEKNEYTILGPYAREPFRYFESIRGKVSYPVYSLLPDFEHTTVFPTCFDDDPHYNKDGARIAAEAIFRMMRADGFFGER
jgi:hypothetical protein